MRSKFKIIFCIVLVLIMIFGCFCTYDINIRFYVLNHTLIHSIDDEEREAFLDAWSINDTDNIENNLIYNCALLRGNGTARTLILTVHSLDEFFISNVRCPIDGYSDDGNLIINGNEVNLADDVFDIEGNQRIGSQFWVQIYTGVITDKNKEILLSGKFTCYNNDNGTFTIEYGLTYLLPNSGYMDDFENEYYYKDFRWYYPYFINYG